MKNCCVYKCRNVCNADARSRGLSFFRFPKDKRIKAVNRDKWEPDKHSWICSDHFLHGWHGDDPSDDNYGPTLFAYKDSRSEEDFKREKRRLDRESTKVYIINISHVHVCDLTLYSAQKTESQIYINFLKYIHSGRRATQIQFEIHKNI